MANGILDGLLSAQVNNFVSGLLGDGNFNPLPINAKLYAKSIFSPGPVNSSSFSKSEIDVLRQALLNSQERYDRNQGPSGDVYRNELRRISGLSPEELTTGPDGYKATVEDIANNMAGRLSNSLQYGDYNSPAMQKSGGIAQTPVSSSFTDPAYAVASAIGRANYKLDQYGNTHVVDKYDFPGARDTQSMSTRERLARLLSRGNDLGWNPTFGLLHTVGEQFSNLMPVDVQIQHGATGKY